MREIIHLQVGECGNRVGTKFWETIGLEHGIDESGRYFGDSEIQLENADVYFRENKGRRAPRAILVDLEGETMGRVRSSPYGKIFRPDNFVFGRGGGGNNWAKGRYTEGAELVDSVMDVVRKVCEECDCVEAFQIFHSLGGGTGSGLGSLIGKMIHKEYHDRVRTAFTVIPSPKVSDTVVEPYNATLSIPELIEDFHSVFCFDNEALYHICNKIENNRKPKHEDLNKYISIAASGVTTSLRFPVNLNSNSRKLVFNLTPYPRLHFLMPGFSPLKNDGNAITAGEITQQLFQRDNMMLACDTVKGKYLSASATFRGKVPMVEVDEELNEIQEKSGNDFTKWIPDNVKVEHCAVPLRNYDKCASVVCNHTSTKQVFGRISGHFTAMYRRKAFLHWYTGEGMDDEEFSHAHDIVLDLINEYTKYEEMK